MISFGCAAVITDSFEVGKAYYHTKQYDKAIGYYCQTIQKDMIHAKAYNNRGAAYFQIGEYNKAIDDFTRSLLIDFKDLKAYNNRGACFYRKGMYDRAIKDFSRAIEIDPKYGTAYYNRGLAYYKKKLRHYSKKDLQTAEGLGIDKSKIKDIKKDLAYSATENLSDFGYDIYDKKSTYDNKLAHRKISVADSPLKGPGKKQIKAIPVDRQQAKKEAPSSHKIKRGVRIIEKSHYTVHFASFKKLSIAKNSVENYKAKGMPAFMKQCEITGKGRWYRLFLGKFEHKGQALLFGELLKAQGDINDYEIMLLR